MAQNARLTHATKRTDINAPKKVPMRVLLCYLAVASFRLKRQVLRVVGVCVSVMAENRGGPSQRGRPKGIKNAGGHTAGGARDGAGRRSNLQKAARNTLDIRSALFGAPVAPAPIVANDAAAMDIVHSDQVREQLVEQHAETQSDPRSGAAVEPEPPLGTYGPEFEQAEQVETPDFPDDDEEADFGQDDLGGPDGVWQAHIKSVVDKLQEEFRNHNFIPQIKNMRNLWIIPPDPGVMCDEMLFVRELHSENTNFCLSSRVTQWKHIFNLPDRILLALALLVCCTVADI